MSEVKGMTDRALETQRERHARIREAVEARYAPVWDALAKILAAPTKPRRSHDC